MTTSLVLPIKIIECTIPPALQFDKHDAIPVSELCPLASTLHLLVSRGVCHHLSSSAALIMIPTHFSSFVCQMLSYQPVSPPQGRKACQGRPRCGREPAWLPLLRQVDMRIGFSYMKGGVRADMLQFET